MGQMGHCNFCSSCSTWTSTGLPSSVKVKELLFMAELISSSELLSLFLSESEAHSANSLKSFWSPSSDFGASTTFGWSGSGRSKKSSWLWAGTWIWCGWWGIALGTNTDPGNWGMKLYTLLLRKKDRNFRKRIKISNFINYLMIGDIAWVGGEQGIWGLGALIDDAEEPIKTEYGT